MLLFAANPLEKLAVLTITDPPNDAKEQAITPLYFYKRLKTLTGFWLFGAVQQYTQADFSPVAPGKISTASFQNTADPVLYL